MKYSPALKLKIAELYATGRNSIEDICTHTGITKDTYYRWRNEKPEFKAALEVAHDARLLALGEMALSGLALLLTKQEFTEVTSEYFCESGIQILKSQRVTTRVIMPNPSTVQYVLNNRMGTEWKNKNQLEHTGKDGETLIPPTKQVMIIGGRTIEF